MTRPTDDRSQPANRETRRREAFGPNRKADDPAEAENNPAFGTGEDHDSYAGRRDQQTRRAATGAGTGGATESDDRVTHHEGGHLGNQPNS